MMTIFYPDISSYEDGLRLQPGTVAVVAKATEGTYYVDKFYSDFQAQAANIGAIFSGYHFLVAGSTAQAQAQAYFNKAGTTPCMLDVETENTSKPSVDLVVAFMEALKSLGGRVWGVYFPRWYWEQVGGDLGRVEASGAVLVSSNYTTYKDGGVGYDAYGGGTPKIWQYTNAQSYGGQSMDFNAFPGTVAQLAAIIYGEQDMDPTTKFTFPPQATGWYPDIAKDGGVWAGQQDFNDLLTMMAARIGHIVHVVEGLQTEVAALKAGGNTVDPVAVADAELAEIKAKL